jgi:predicted transcriptional regulator
MPGNTEQLKATLSQLQQQLAGIGELDPAQEQQLASALAEIQAALKSKILPESKSPANESLMRRLGEAARHFEEEHPTLASTIGSLIATLGRSGI